MCRCVRGILRRSAWAAALTVALFGASPSNAGTLTVDFNLNNSTLMLGTLLNVPAGMDTVTGSARVVLTGVNESGMITDASMAGGSVSGLSLMLTLNQPVLLNGAPIPGITASLVGPISVTQMGMATGMFDGAAVTLPTGSFVTQLATNIDVAGPSAATIRLLGPTLMPPLTFPIQQMTPIANTDAPFTFTLAGLGGTAMINAAVVTMNMGQAVSLTFAGTETARTFAGDAGGGGGGGGGGQAPEPVEAGLLILGVLALCGVSAVRRQLA